jgi:hypothetical protein
MRCSGARPLGSAIACYNLGPCWTARTVDVGRSLLRSGLPLVAPASATDCNQCFRVAASSKSTAAGSSSSATTRINHRKTTSSAWPRRVARYRTGRDRPRRCDARPPPRLSRSSGPRGPSPRPGACRQDCCASPAVVRRPAAQSLEIGDVLKVMAELNDYGGGVERCASPPACRAPERQRL